MDKGKDFSERTNVFSKIKKIGEDLSMLMRDD
jgi:hypothetical protein